MFCVFVLPQHPPSLHEYFFATQHVFSVSLWFGSALLGVRLLGVRGAVEGILCSVCLSFPSTFLPFTCFLLLSICSCYVFVFGSALLVFLMLGVRGGG